MLFFFLRIRRPPRTTRTDTLFPYTTLFRSCPLRGEAVVGRNHSQPARRTARTAIPPSGYWSSGSSCRAGSELDGARRACNRASIRSEEHTSELQSRMRISYAVFCLKKKKKVNNTRITQKIQ